MRTMTAFLLTGLLIALPAAAQTSGGSGGTSGSGAGTATSGPTVGVSPSGAGATHAASRNCEKAGNCETPLTGRYMRIVNSMARLACGSCASR